MLAKAAEMQLEAWYELYVKPGTQDWKWRERVFSLKLFLRPRVSEIGLLTGTSP